MEGGRTGTFGRGSETGTTRETDLVGRKSRRVPMDEEQEVETQSAVVESLPEQLVEQILRETGSL